MLHFYDFRSVLLVTKVILDWYEGQEKVDLSDYVNSGTWDIIGCPGFIN